MKRTLILYIYVENPESSFLQILSSRYQVRLCHIVEEKNWEKEDWNLVVFQDDVYGVLSKQELRELRKFPWLFVSIRPGTAFRRTNDVKLISFVQKTGCLFE